MGTFCFGDDKYLLGRYAWFDENSGNMTHPVGQLKPNAWNLHEMHGNVWEWCQDWYGHDYYRILSQKNLTGPYRGSGRVVRGGSWVNSAFYCRSACRSIRDPASLYNFDPGYRSGALGFRLLRSP